MTNRVNLPNTFRHPFLLASMTERPRIALLIELSRTYRRELLRGIAGYARAHGPWAFHHHERPMDSVAVSQLENWNGDGIISRVEDGELMDRIVRLGLPTVCPFGMRRWEGIPRLDTNHAAVVKLAADHLLECGIRQFAYCGFAGVDYSEQRAVHFEEYLRADGFAVDVYEGPHPMRLGRISSIEESARFSASLASWIGSLPKPVGLLACNDMCGQQVLSACVEHGIRVPDDVAVIGVDNDEVLCELCTPLLSSVEPNTQRIGYETAALLDRMMRGESPSGVETLIEPLRVVKRQSTDMLAIDDADVVAAVRYIREHACRGIQVEDVLQNVMLSRSTLERRFAKHIGRTPRAEIARVQLQRVNELLTITDFPLTKVAQLAGFQHVESMCRAFKKSTGHSPGRYRKRS